MNAMSGPLAPVLRRGPDMRFFEESMSVLTGSAFQTVADRPAAGRYFILLAVLNFVNLKDEDQYPSPLSYLDKKDIADCKKGRASLILDLSNEGPPFDVETFLPLHRRLDTLEIRHDQVVFVSQNRRLHEDHAAFFRSDGLRFWTLDYFPLVIVNMISVDRLNCDLGSYKPLSGTEDKLFNCLNSAPRWHRVLLYRWLQNNEYLGDGLISFHGATNANPKSGEIDLGNPPPSLVRSFAPLLDDLKRHLPKEPVRFDADGRFGNELAANLLIDAYAQSHVTIITESDFFFTKTARMTEKTMKALVLGHPFIVFGAAGTVSLARELGFLSFDLIINHMYDDIEDDIERMKACLESLASVLNDIKKDPKAWRDRARPIAEANIQHARTNLIARLQFLTLQPILNDMQLHPEHTGAERNIGGVIEALALLTPHEIDRQKIRLGPNTDGGYVLAAPIEPDASVVSYGISTEFRFDEDMADLGHKVFMFDHTIPPPRLKSSNMTFVGEGIGIEPDATARLDTLSNHLKRFDIRNSNNILKIDVEGVEFEIFDSLSDNDLLSFEQIVMEVHGLARLDEPAFRSKFIDVFSMINKSYTLFHVHGNNYDGCEPSFVRGIPVANLIELSYIRTSSVSRQPNLTLYPTTIDFPCVDAAEKLLWFFPFMPTSISAGHFKKDKERFERLETRTARLQAGTRTFDVKWYREHYIDLTNCSDDYLKQHFQQHGIKEGRFGSENERYAFEHDLI